MRFAPPEEALDLYKTGFENDLLGRKKVGQRLSEVLQRTEDPLVVALDGRWGTGKSHFLQRWVGEHLRQYSGEANTLYFDAFAHDYLSDPLVALVGALSERLKGEQPKLEGLKNAASKLIKPALRVALGTVAGVGVVVANDIGDGIIEALRREAEKGVGDLWKREEGRQAAMEEFRKALGALTAAKGGEAPTPLIIVVDELDRCRPDYALEILEIIKHFFAVPHVHFVLGANLEALENSVRARYGTGIDATAYLQKFLSFTVTLPEHVGDGERTSVILKYADHLETAMKMPDDLRQEVHTQLRILSRNNSISLRDVGKVMSMVALLPDSVQKKKVSFARLVVTITLVITRIIQPKKLQRLRDSMMSDKELVAYLGTDEPRLNRHLADGKRNPDFEDDTLNIYLIWKFIREDGAPHGREDWPSVRDWFSGSHAMQGYRTIPRQIYDTWLSDFRLPG